MARRFRTLAILELFNAAFLPFVAYGVVGWPVSVANGAGTLPAVVLLIQGAGYWWLKRRQVEVGAALPDHLAHFARLQRGNVVLLAVTLGVVIVGLVVVPGRRSLPGVGFWLLAVAEHVNYFHVQLMHDTGADLARLGRRRHLAASALARDLDRWRSRPPT